MKRSEAVIPGIIGRSGRTKLYRWLWDNYDRVLKEQVGCRSGWVDAAEEFKRLGFTAKVHGKKGGPRVPKGTTRPVEAEDVRQAWLRVVADKKKAAAKAAESAAAAPAAVQPVARVSAPAIFPTAVSGQAAPIDHDDGYNFTTLKGEKL